MFDRPVRQKVLTRPDSISDNDKLYCDNWNRWKRRSRGRLVSFQTCTRELVSFRRWSDHRVTGEEGWGYIFLENSNACRNIKKFFSRLNLLWLRGLKFSLFNDLDLLKLLFFFSLSNFKVKIVVESRLLHNFFFFTKLYQFKLHYLLVNKVNSIILLYNNK